MVPAISRLRLSNSIVIGRDPNLGPADLPGKAFGRPLVVKRVHFPLAKERFERRQGADDDRNAGFDLEPKILPACFWVRVVLLCHSFTISR